MSGRKRVVIEVDDRDVKDVLIGLSRFVNLIDGPFPKVESIEGEKVTERPEYHDLGGGVTHVVRGTVTDIYRHGQFCGQYSNPVTPDPRATDAITDPPAPSPLKACNYAEGDLVIVDSPEYECIGVIDMITKPVGNRVHVSCFARRWKCESSRWVALKDIDWFESERITRADATAWNRRTP